MRTVLAIVKSILLELFRKKDFYVLLIFLVGFLGFISLQNFFGVEGISRYMRDFGYTISIFFTLIITITFTARQIPFEIESKTIYPMLAKPISRFKLVLGKFFGSVAVSFISFTLYYGVFMLFCINKGENPGFMLLFQGFLFGLLMFCLVAALVMFFSMFLTVAANVAVTFMLYFFFANFTEPIRNAVLYGKGISAIMMSSIYYLIPHFDFYDLRVRLTHSWDPLPGWIVFSMVIYTFIYCALLLYFAGVIFRRKKL